MRWILSVVWTVFADFSFPSLFWFWIAVRPVQTSTWPALALGSHSASACWYLGGEVRPAVWQSLWHWCRLSSSRLTRECSGCVGCAVLFLGHHWIFLFVSRGRRAASSCGLLRGLRVGHLQRLSDLSISLFGWGRAPSTVPWTSSGLCCSQGHLPVGLA